MFRLAVTADLHHDVARSRASAEELAATWPDLEADALLLVGDAATSDGDKLETALSLFADDGRPRLFVPGNHELWSKHYGTDVRVLLGKELPRRVRDLGWHWLPGHPFRPPSARNVAVVGTLGWYDYGFALKRLALPRRFYEAKVSPSAAASLHGDELRPTGADVPDRARGFYARWNDSRFIAGLKSDEQFCQDRLDEFEADLESVSSASHVVAAVHVCPHRSLLPPIPDGEIPERALKYAFARAYLGSPTFGDLALSKANVRHIVCGHSHVERRQLVDGVDLLNVGSGYEEKKMAVLRVGSRQGAAV